MKPRNSFIYEKLDDKTNKNNEYSEYAGHTKKTTKI